MYNSYAKGLGATEEVLSWVETTLQRRLLNPKKKEPSQTEVEHLLDYLCSAAGPKKLKRMSYEQAEVKAAAWTKAQQKKGSHIEEQASDTKTIKKFTDGARIAKLVGKAAFEREGFLMRHCVASYYNRQDIEVYSYRDKENEPHATFEVLSSNGQIQQIKGKGNGSIHPKYIKPVVAFLKKLGVPVRSSEMKNLGYINVDKETKALIEEFVPKLKTTKFDSVDYIFTGPL